MTLPNPTDAAPERDGARDERQFPIQCERGAKPHQLLIPWSVAELAYSVYAGRYGSGQSLERLAKRGGFGPGEMDIFLPDWRERCDELVRLRAERDSLLAENRRMGEENRKVEHHCVQGKQRCDNVMEGLTRGSSYYFIIDAIRADFVDALAALAHNTAARGEGERT